MEQTFEEFINQQINDGYIATDGTPLKCPHCDGKKFTACDHIYLDYIYGHGVNLMEYKLKCDECQKDVGYWVAGQWEL